jgi:hypothetical protein
MTSTLTPIATGDPPAGGAATGDLIVLALIWTILGIILVAMGAGHRSGRWRGLERAAGATGRLFGLPGWAALPLAVMLLAEVFGLSGFYWDVLTHVDHGRDAGAFGNPAHFPVLAGVAGIVVAGALAIVIGGGERGAIRLTRRWTAPLGGAMILATGVFALTAFPLDDAWHRVFGQDVTAWGPTHLLALSAANFSVVGLWVLFADGRAAALRGRIGRPPRRLVALEVVVAGVFLLNLNEQLVEYDIGVPQYRLLFHPVIVAAIAGLALTAARIRIGRGGALGAVSVFLVVRGLISLGLGVAGYTTLHFALYLGEAIAVELIAARISSRKPITLGLAAGAAIGTFGLAVEAVWSRVWMAHEWTAPLMPEVLVLVPAAAIAGGLVGSLLGRALSDGDARAQRVPRWLAPVAAVVILGCLAYPISTTGGHGISGAVTLQSPHQGPDGLESNFSVRMTPPDVAKGSEYFYGIAFQGGGLRRTALVKTGPGTYRSAAPLPLGGKWKTAIRIGKGNLMTALPIHLPADTAIPAKALPALPSFSRPFVAEKTLLRREEKKAPGGLWTAGYVAVGLIGLFWVVALSSGVRRYDRHGKPVDTPALVPLPAPEVAAKAA